MENQQQLKATGSSSRQRGRPTSTNPQLTVLPCGGVGLSALGMSVTVWPTVPAPDD
jgi:hypothetical protein